MKLKEIAMTVLFLSIICTIWTSYALAMTGIVGLLLGMLPLALIALVAFRKFRDVRRKLDLV